MYLPTKTLPNDVSINTVMKIKLFGGVGLGGWGGGGGGGGVRVDVNGEVKLL